MNSADERRGHERVVLPLLVQYRFDAFEELRAEYVEDISEGGLFIKTAGRRSIGDRVHLQFVLRGGSRLAELEGTVVRVDGDGPEPGLAVEFLTPDHGAREVLQALVGSAPKLQVETEDLLAAGP